MINLLTLDGTTAVVQEQLNGQLHVVLEFCTKYHLNERINVRGNNIVFKDYEDYLVVRSYFKDELVKLSQAMKVLFS